MAGQSRAAVIEFPTRRDTSVLGSEVTVTSSVAATGGTVVAGQTQAVPVSASAAQAQLLTIQNVGNGHVFVYPLSVSVDHVGDEWFATSPDLALVGRGESDLDAVDDLRAGVADLFDSLLDMRHELGPLMRDQLALLERLAGLK